jgi:hypothetical protein
MAIKWTVEEQNVRVNIGLRWLRIKSQYSVNRAMNFHVLSVGG